MEDDNYSGSMTEGKVTHREYIRNTANTPPDWKYIRSTAEINKLGETVATSDTSGLRHALSHISRKEVQDA